MPLLGRNAPYDGSGGPPLAISWEEGVLRNESFMSLEPRKLNDRERTGTAPFRPGGRKTGAMVTFCALRHTFVYLVTECGGASGWFPTQRKVNKFVRHFYTSQAPRCVFIASSRLFYPQQHRSTESSGICREYWRELVGRLAVPLWRSRWVDRYSEL